MGAALGILTPFCSASMVPVAMGMIEMSAPFSTVLPFLISAPLCNFVVVGIIFGTFGWKIGLIYFLWTFCGAIFAGLTVGRSKIKNQVKNLAEIAESKTKIVFLVAALQLLQMEDIMEKYEELFEFLVRYPTCFSYWCTSISSH